MEHRSQRHDRRHDDEREQCPGPDPASLRDREPHEDHDERDADVATVLHDVRGERPRHVRERPGSDHDVVPREEEPERIGRCILRRAEGGGWCVPHGRQQIREPEHEAHDHEGERGERPGSEQGEALRPPGRQRDQERESPEKGGGREQLGGDQEQAEQRARHQRHEHDATQRAFDLPHHQIHRDRYREDQDQVQVRLHLAHHVRREAEQVSACDRGPESPRHSVTDEVRPPCGEGRGENLERVVARERSEQARDRPHHDGRERHEGRPGQVRTTRREDTVREHDASPMRERPRRPRQHPSVEVRVPAAVREVPRAEIGKHRPGPQDDRGGEVHRERESAFRRRPGSRRRLV